MGGNLCAALPTNKGETATWKAEDEGTPLLVMENKPNLVALSAPFVGKKTGVDR